MGRLLGLIVVGCLGCVTQRAWSVGGRGAGDYAQVNGLAVVGGDLVVAGCYQGTLAFDPARPLATKHGGFVARLTGDGRPIWIHELREPCARPPRLAAGDRVAVLWFPLLTQSPRLEVFDRDGRALWSKSFATIVRPETIAIAGDDVVLAGLAIGPFTDDPTITSAAGGSTTFVARLGPAGALRWSAPVGGTVAAMAVDAAGRIDAVGGERVTQLAADGAIRWTRTVAGTSLRAVAADERGRVAVAGYVDAPVRFAGRVHAVIPTEGGMAGFVAAYAVDGTEAWGRALGRDGCFTSVQAVAAGATVVAIVGNSDGTERCTRIDLGGHSLDVIDEDRGGRTVFLIGLDAGSGALASVDHIDGEVESGGVAVDGARVWAAGWFTGRVRIGGVALSTHSQRYHVPYRASDPTIAAHDAIARATGIWLWRRGR